MSLEDIDVDLLISAVEEKPILWNKSVEEYKDRSKTRDAWISVCCQLKENFEHLSNEERKEFGKLIIKRWTNIRDQWMRWKRKLKDVNKSGAGATTLKKYVYNEQLKFLEKVPLHRSTTSTMDTTDYVDLQQTPEIQILAEKTPPKISSIRKRKRPLDDFEQKMLKFVETPEPENRHLMFFKGIVPSLNAFTNNQILDFQMGVLQLIRNISNGLPALSPPQSFYPSPTSPFNLYSQYYGPAYTSQYYRTSVQQHPCATASSSNFQETPVPTTCYSFNSPLQATPSTSASHVATPQPVQSPNETILSISESQNSISSNDNVFTQYSDFDF